MNNNPLQRLQDGPMSKAQIVSIAIVIACVGLDGFDVLAISYASPGIAAEWHIDRSALGIVLSMELLGMAIGAITLGALADRIGRRNTILMCLSLMCIGMACVTWTRTIAMLCVLRVLTGLGIGGMFASANALVAETSNLRRRDLCVTLMTVGYPLGAIAAGLFAENLLKGYGWRSIFVVGSLATLVMIPIVLLRLPESVSWLYTRRPPGALGAGAGQPNEQVRLTDPGYARKVILLTLVYTLHFITFYFLLKWVPKIVVDLGYPASGAASVLVWANVGSAIGGAGIGLLAQRFPIRALTGILMLGSTIMVCIFGRGQNSLAAMGWICLLTGICTSAGGAGIYAIIASSFPPGIRASGTGIVIGFGRGGTVLAPIIAGYLFSYGYGLQTVAIIMGCGSLIAALLLALSGRSALAVPTHAHSHS
jgi:MFS family permease